MRVDRPPSTEGFAAALAHLLDVPAGDVPAAVGPDPFVRWRGWLAARGLGLAPIAAPERFSWAGYWLARLREGRWVVMFGVPSGIVFDPAGDAPPADVGVEAGFAVAPLDLSPTRAAGASSPGQGVVEALFVAASAGAPMQSRASVEARPEGLAEDRYARGAGTFSDPSATGTALTLIEAEMLEATTLPDGSRLPADQARRNVVTRGVRLDALIGRRFTVGGVECFGQRRCEPCAHMQRLTQRGVLRAFVHRGGLRCDVLTAGIVRVGDPIAANVPI